LLIAVSCVSKKPDAAGSIDSSASKTWNDRSARLNSEDSYRETAEAADTAIRFNRENAFAWNYKSMALIGSDRGTIPERLLQPSCPSS